MSHIVEMKIEINSLEALRKAVEALGLKFNEGQKTYRWYGYSTGPVPEGITEDMLGKCEHAISVPGNTRAYEIGVYTKANGTFGLLYDHYNNGYGLQEFIGAKNGTDCKKLTTEYALQRAELEAATQGWYCVRQGDELTVYHPDGGNLKVTEKGITASGFAGGACTVPTMVLADALGQQQEVVNTAEYYTVDQTLELSE